MTAIDPKVYLRAAELVDSGEVDNWPSAIRHAAHNQKADETHVMLFARTFPCVPAADWSNPTRILCLLLAHEIAKDEAKVT